MSILTDIKFVIRACEMLGLKVGHNSTWESQMAVVNRNFLKLFDWHLSCLYSVKKQKVKITEDIALLLTKTNKDETILTQKLTTQQEPFSRLKMNKLIQFEHEPKKTDNFL